MSDSYFKEVKNLFHKILDINFNSCYTNKKLVNKEKQGDKDNEYSIYSCKLFISSYL